MKRVYAKAIEKIDTLIEYKCEVTQNVLTINISNVYQELKDIRHLNAAVILQQLILAGNPSTSGG